MALEQSDNAEARSFVSNILPDSAGLSRSVQDFFQPIDRAIANRQEMPWALDFGTGADLYQSAAYTGERLSARSLMADDVEQKLDAQKIQAPSDALTRPSVIRTKEDEAIWDEMQKPHKLGKHESATHIGLSPEVIAEMQAKGQASKLEFFDSAAEGALAALQKPSAEQVLIASSITPGVPNLEQMQQYPDIHSDSSTSIDESLIAQGFTFPNAVDIYKKEIEHKYRGKELATMEKDIPKEKWDEAYKAFPELNQLGEKDATNLMKAIIANELDHYGAEDLTEDAVAKTGHGGGFHGQSIGYGQISPDGIRDMAKQFDKAVENHQRASNPLAKYEKMTDDKLAQELANPANAPLFVAAHIALDLQNLTHHAKELHPTPEALGYWYNADMAYAKSDKKHEHLMTKKEAKAKHISYDPALPTDTVLEKSEHAENIRKWLEKTQ